MKLAINDKCSLNVSMGIPTSVCIPIKYYDASYYQTEIKPFVIFSLKKCGWDVELNDPSLSEDEEFIIIKIKKIF